jgi:chlorobactene glucosyltransferase
MIVPLLNFFLLSLLPLLQVYKSRRVSFTAGIGQFILFRRDAYERTGGHLRFSTKIAEDLELLREAKKRGITLMTAVDRGLVQCRMYQGLSESINGFSKNFYAGSGLSPLKFFLLLSFYVFIFLVPFVLVFTSPIYIAPLMMILLIRIIIAKLSRQDLLQVFFHPLQMMLMYYVGLRSLFLKKKEWKGRLV